MHIQWISNTEFLALSNNMKRPFYYKIEGSMVKGNSTYTVTDTSVNKLLFMNKK